MRICRTCGQPEEPHNYRHPFVAEDDPFAEDGLGKKKKDREEQVQRAGLPLDPVLRVALINKGVITPEDLDQAYKQVKVTSEGTTITSERRN